MLTITPATAMDFLDDCFDAGQVPCLIGDPGSGKSDAYRYVARHRSADYRAWPIGLYATEDLMGVPSLEGGRTIFNPPALGIFTDDRINRELIVHLEELPHASIPVQGALYEMLLDRSINGKPIHPLVRFGASGNPMSNRAASNHLSTALRSRMVMARFQTDIRVWLRLARELEYPPLMIAFMTMMAERGEESALSGFDPRAEGNSPNPRGWSKAVELWNIMERKKRPLDYRLTPLAGVVGEGRATEFIGFCRVWESLPDLREIERNPTGATRPEDGEVAVIYATVSALAFRATKANLGAFITYCSLLGNEYCTVFVSMATSRDGGLTDCSAYMQWAAANRSRAT